MSIIHIIGGEVMMNVLKRYDLEMVKRKFQLIYILNVTDIIFTLVLLRTGMFFEGNIFMRPFVASEYASIMLKIGLPIILLYYVFKRMAKATQKQLISSNLFINFCLVLYTFINVSHVLCTIV